MSRAASLAKLQGASGGVREGHSVRRRRPAPDIDLQWPAASHHKAEVFLKLGEEKKGPKPNFHAVDFAVSRSAESSWSAAGWVPATKLNSSVVKMA